MNMLLCIYVLKYPNHVLCLIILVACISFLATLVALHFTPVSRWVGRSRGYRTLAPPDISPH